MNYYKQTLFGFIMLLILYGVVELAVFIVYFATEGQPFSFARMQIAMAEAIGPENNADPEGMNNLSDWVAHPYWGYVMDWGAVTPDQLSARDAISLARGKELASSNAEGEILNGLDYAIPIRTAGAVNVVVLGGSVAIQIARRGSSQLIEELQKFDEYRGRKIIIYNAAQAALKQPQQITKLSYLFALGSEFDVIINIDGLNEVYHSMNNNKLGINPFFPHYWSSLVEKVGSSASIQIIAETTFLRERRSGLARLVADSPLRFSITCNTMWLLLDRWLSSQITLRRIQLDEHRASNTYVANGPRFPLNGQAPLPQEIADTWMRGSLGLKALADGFGAMYFHFLQPNQYLPNSKPMEPSERKQAFLDDSNFNVWVPSIYPGLIENGKQLRAAGVNFFDLTMIFKNQREARYKDTCCHVNKAGAQELARQIGRSIVNRLEVQKKSITDEAVLVSSNN